MKSHSSISWRIAKYLLGYTFGLLAVLWIFQIHLLPRIYQEYRKADVTGQVTALGKDMSNPNITRRIVSFAKEETACIRVVTASGTEVLSLDLMPYCAIHSLDKQSLRELWSQAEENGGTKTEIYAMTGNLLYRQIPSGSQAILHVQVFEPPGREAFAIYYNSALSPINGMLSVLQIILKIITAAAVCIAAVMVWWISRTTVRPITQVAERVRRLKAQDYTVKFEGGGFREIEELNEVLNETSQALDQLDRMRSEIFAKASHDLRTPLSMIIAYGEAMRDIPGENTPENVQVIIDEARRMSDLVNNILVYPELPGAGQTAPNFTRFDFGAQCRAIIRQHQHLKAGGSCAFLYDGPESLWVCADKVRMSQVLYNLLSNAMAHSGGATEIRLTVRREGDMIYTAVSDNGKGIPKDEQELVWEVNYSKAEEDGYHRGLGLAIVRSILEQHHAQFGVESESGRGCTFYFRFPEDARI